jgi:glycosyltransferase involved in cell wall biosynthesis
MTLTVLSVASPSAPVDPDLFGAAERVLLRLDEALVEAGHRSVVLAPEGWRGFGEVIAVPPVPRLQDEKRLWSARELHRRAVEGILYRAKIDLVHMHGIDFRHYLPPPGVPVLATLHAPADWYGPEALRPTRPDTWLNPVSDAQAASLRPNPHLLPAVNEGIDVPDRLPPHAKRRFALVLSTIAPEHGIDIALDAARKAGIPLLVVGDVPEGADGALYFREEIALRLDALRRYVGPIAGARTERLLAAARCLLVPSLVEETSPLLAREALALGTPVVGFADGPLAGTIDHGRTGFLVSDPTEMAGAIATAPVLDPETCRRIAAERFSTGRMVGQYFDLYDYLAKPHEALMAGQ